MSDDNSNQQSGPSNPWSKPSGAGASVPGIASSEPSNKHGVDSDLGRPGPEGTGQVPDRSVAVAGAVYYDDSDGGLVPLAIKGYLLTLVTLGIYRFWYLTNLRRFFWSHTRVCGSALEYTGRGMEIFIGFLIALAIIVPLNFVPILLAASVGPAGSIVSVFLPLVYFFLILFAIYRSRRYRVNRTLWRGMRCHQTGSGWGYALRAFGWTFACLLSLGLCLPWALTELYRYRIERMHLGTVPFSFNGDWRLIAKPYWILWAVFCLPLLLFLVAAAFKDDIPSLLGALRVLDDGQLDVDASKWDSQGKWLIQFGPVFLFWLLLGFLSIPFYYARRTSALFSATELLGIRCEARIPAGQLYWTYFLYTLILVLAFAVVIGIVVMVFMGMGGSGSDVSGVVIGIYLLVYLAAFMTLGLAGVLILQRKVWATVVGSIVVLNPERLDEVAGRMLDGEGGFGAGFADAMDIGDFDVGL